MDTNLVDIVRQIISQIDLNIKVISIAGDVVNVCNTMHITLGKIVEDDQGNKYKVVDFSFNEWIKVTPYNHVNAFAGLYVKAPDILFLHGSPSSTNNEYVKLKGHRTLNKTPFIWLLVSYTQNALDADSSIEASYDARLFFMDWANTPKWINDQHNDLVIKPMENLSKAFLDVINNDYNFKKLNGYSRIPRPRFGVEISDKGSDKTIIHEDLSGIDLSLTLEMYNTALCCSK